MTPDGSLGTFSIDDKMELKVGNREYKLGIVRMEASILSLLVSTTIPSYGWKKGLSERRTNWVVWEYLQPFSQCDVRAVSIDPS